MNDLKVPFGIREDGRITSAENADKGREYYCPACDEKLVFRDGGVRNKHFSHLPDTSCTLETILHKCAKRMVFDAIHRNVSGHVSISILNGCHECGSEYETKLPPKTFTDAAVEEGVGAFVCDVVGYRGADAALAIEILVTHAVDSRKANELSIPWMELSADAVFSDPHIWRPVQGRLKSHYCPECRSNFKKIQEVADRWKIDRSLYSPIKDPQKSTYIAAVETCFKCKEEIPVFWWSGIPFCEVEPPEPRPKTIKFRNSKQFGGSYWANTCAKCGMIQGDNYLFLFQSAPLRGLPIARENMPGESGHGPLRIIAGDSAVSEFMKVVNRNIPWK
ncbi:MAG: competence protein CoiA family protein [Pseudomonadota bacterium]